MFAYFTAAVHAIWERFYTTDGFINSQDDSVIIQYYTPNNMNVCELMLFRLVMSDHIDHPA